MTGNMPDNLNDDYAQLKALMKVIDEITQNKVPLIVRMAENLHDDTAQLKALNKVIDKISNNEVPLVSQPADIYMPKVTEFVTNKNIRNLQNWCNEYAFEDGDLVGELKSAIIEFQYLLIVIKDLRERLTEQNIELERLGEYKDYLATENRRLENELNRGN